MKIVHEELLIDAGPYSQTPDYLSARAHVFEAISKVVWPEGGTEFAIFPERHGNGVLPIKYEFQAYLEQNGWQLEVPLDLGVTVSRPGPLDAVLTLDDGHFAVEWETGNISSSHRALNKLALGLIRGVLAGACLIIPSRRLYPYLTDRIGNYEELAPYFDVYRQIRCDCGVLSVIAVEHDSTDRGVPLIPKGLDGMSLRRRLTG